MLRLNEGPVHQHIHEGEHVVRHLAPAAAGLCAGELLPGVAGVAPHALARAQAAEGAQEQQQPVLIFRLHGLAAQEGNALHIRRGHAVHNELLRLRREEIAIGKIPGDLIEASGAAVGAAGYEQAVQSNVAVNAKGEIVTDLTAPVLTKNALLDGYGMRPASPIGKEWFEQAAGFSAWITGKTFADALAMGVNEKGYPTEADVITTCTMNVNDIMVVLRKAQ